jgi:hypothetical protein
MIRSHVCVNTALRIGILVVLTVVIIQTRKAYSYINRGFCCTKWDLGMCVRMALTSIFKVFFPTMKNMKTWSTLRGHVNHATCDLCHTFAARITSLEHLAQLAYFWITASPCIRAMMHLRNPKSLHVFMVTCTECMWSYVSAPCPYKLFSKSL